MKHHSGLKQAFIFIEFLIILLSFLIAFYLRQSLSSAISVELNFMVYELSWMLIISILIHYIFNNLDQNSSYINTDYKNSHLLIQNFIEMVCISSIIFLIKEKNFSRLFLALYFISKITLTILARFFLASFIRKVSREITLTILCPSIEGREESIPSKYQTILRLDNLEKEALELIDKKIKNEILDRVIILGNLDEVAALKDNIQIVQSAGLELSLSITELNNNSVISVENSQGDNFLSLSLTYRSMLFRVYKLLFDPLIGFVGGVITCCLFILLYIPIRLSCQNSVLFTQTRIGKNGREFKLYKFRTMKSLSKESLKDDTTGPMFKMKKDPRITKLGQFLRSTSLDEMPQFFNVLKGEMSVVGPRPPLPDEVKKYKLEFYRRISVKPGITGLWQVNSRNTSLNFDDVLKDDIDYIKRSSISLDIKIMLKTIWVMLTMKGR